MWAPILPNMVVNENIAVSSGGRIGWAYRKNSPLLAAVLEDFYYNFAKPSGTFPYLFKKYSQQAKRLKDPTNDDSWKRYKEIVTLFEKYGGKYDFDALMLTALGFQESQLNQNTRSHVGAVGVMQLMPATGASMKVGDIKIMENNIHAGAKYLNTLMTKYFKDAKFDEFNRSLFAFASYNAGPGRVAGLRRAAAQQGLNPDVWLHNVEIVASEKIGKETTTYVRNIVKYFYSYKLMSELMEERRKQMKAQ
jgi:membrane-bound lytic murein transglycosylase MltF